MRINGKDTIQTETSNSFKEAFIIGKTKSAILKNEKYIFWCFPAISGASV